MRNLKKVLSLVLCMAMMLSIMVVGAGAAFKDQSKIVNEEAVDMCSALNIINGYTDGSFRPEGTITRAEACKMICVALNGGKEPVLGTNATASFTDIKGHWAEGYIEYCVSEGIVAGIGGGKFNPNGNVTGSQFAKMLLIALGYRADHEKFVGNAWEVNVNVKATQRGLYEDLASMDPSVALTRDNAAQMVWNALQAKEVAYEYTLTTENGQLVSKVTVGDKQVNNHTITLLADKYGVVDGESAQMTGFTYNSDKDEWTYYFNNTSTVAAQQTPVARAEQTPVADGNLTYTSFTSSVDYTDLYMQNVKVVYTVKNNKVDKVFGMYADDSKVLATAYVGDFDTVKSADDEVTIADVDYDLEKTADNTPVYNFLYGNPNYVPLESNALTAIAGAQANVAFEITAVDYDDNGDIDFFVMHKFEVGQVQSLGSKNFTTKDLTKNSFELEKVVAYNGLAEDDYVVYTPAKYSATNDDTFTKVDTVLKGKITAYKNATEYAVDGTWYEAVREISGIKSGGNIKDAPVVNGYIFDAKTTGTSDIEDYALIVSIVNSGDNGINGAQAKLLFADGTKKVVDLDKDYDFQDGWFVTYDVNSDNEYELTIAISNQENNNNQQTGFDQVTNMKAFAANDLNKNTNKIKYLNGWNIADDAVIFVNDAGDYKVITGAQLKSTSGANVSQIIAYANEDSSTGYNTVAMAKIVFTKDSVSADNTYGFVTAAPIQVQNADNKTVTELKIWTEEGKEVTLNTKAGFDVPKALAKGSIISYSVNADNEIDKLNVETTVGSTSGVANSNKTAAVVAYDGTYVTLNGAATRYEITKDTVIVYINADKSAGSDNGSIKLATKTAGAVSGDYYNNVYMIPDGTDVDTIFVDINNDIDDLM